MAEELKIYQDSDVEYKETKNKTIAVLGYGIQGRAQALCWKDSGFNVVVGARKGGNSFKQAQQDGLETTDLTTAAEKGDVICFLTPDMTHKKIYEENVAPLLKRGKTLYFSHGFSITFNRVNPPKDVDVIMVAPKGPGKRVREVFESGFGVPALIAVQQNASGNAKQTALALAKGLGSTRAGVFECDFNSETITDLFGEQAVLCGGCAELIKAGFDTLVEAGYPPQMAYFECLHELKLITDLVQEGGISFMWKRVSETARYGGWTRGNRVITDKTRREMKEILKEVQDGRFAKEWISEYEAGMPKFKELDEKESQLLIEKTGEKIRSLFTLKK
ncbi:MAG: ketol-acid reductoisomerase [Candidatus Micrarchaeia archaeon]